MKKEAPSPKGKLTLSKTRIKDFTVRSGVRTGAICWDTCRKSQCIGTCVLTCTGGITV
jgi:hypothetical protein